MSKASVNEYQIYRKRINSELKLCPFCGGEARLKKHYKFKQTWYVQCNTCGMRTTNSTQADYESWKTAMNLPVHLWNRRISE